MAKKLSRRNFFECALAGGAAAGTANLTIMRGAFAQASGPIVIGHHCDLTGAIVVGCVARQGSQGRGGPDQPGGWDRRAQGGTGDRGYRIESGEWCAQAAQPDPAHQCRIHRRLGSFRRDAGGDPDRDRTQDDLLLDRRGDRSDRQQGNTLFVPHRYRYLLDCGSQPSMVRRKLWQGLDDHLRGLRLGAEHVPRIERSTSSAPAARFSTRYPCHSMPRISCPTSRRSPPIQKCCCRRSLARCRSHSIPRLRAWGSTRK